MKLAPSLDLAKAFVFGTRDHVLRSMPWMFLRALVRAMEIGFEVLTIMLYAFVGANIPLFIAERPDNPVTIPGSLLGVVVFALVMRAVRVSVQDQSEHTVDSLEARINAPAVKQ